MASTVFVPFNNDPVSVSPLTTTGYTVPVGKFAKLTGILYHGTLLVNGTPHLYSNGHATFGSSSTTSTSTGNITLVTAPTNVAGFATISYSWASQSNLGYTATFSWLRGGTTLWSVTEGDETTTQAGSTSGFVRPGDIFRTSQSNAVSWTRSITVSANGYNPTEIDLWLPSESVVTFSSGNYLPSVDGQITIYNAIS